MPEEYARRLAKQLIEHADEDPLVVDVPNDGFNVAVKHELEQLGFHVERHEFKNRLTIHLTKQSRLGSSGN